MLLVKLGGSLITDKNRPGVANHETIARLAREIHEARLEKRFDLVVGHGGGSFPHVVADKYKTQAGIVGKESYRGIAEVQSAAAQLNRIVVEALLVAGENAISFQPSASLLAEKGRIRSWYLESLKQALSFGMVPVPYGDVAFDTKQGCSIISTEEIFYYLAGKLGAERIILVAKEDGVFEDYPARRKLIPEITPSNFKPLRKSLLGSHGTDVTGGMLHKVDRMLELAEEKGVETLIINGEREGRLKDALLGKKVPGTIIRR